MTFRLSARSESRLAGVHPDLVAVVRRAIQITPVDFGVLEGRRSFERQKMLFEQGHSQTLNSRHLTGHAVDLFAWVLNERTGKHEVSWASEHYWNIAKAMFAAELDCAQLGKITHGPVIRWGGDWRTFKDLTHFELSRQGPAGYPRVDQFHA